MVYSLQARTYSVLTVVLLAWAAAAGAQNYPVKSVRIVVPQAPGSLSDAVARVVGQRMAGMLGQQIVIDNRAGAGGLLGTEMVAKAAPDGYTLLLASISTHGTIPALYSKLPFEPIKDFAPVAMYTTSPNVLSVHPSLPVRTVKELIALARANSGQINIGSQGNGSSQHLSAELFNLMAGNLKMVHVPYKGSGASLTAALTGEVSVLMPTLGISLPHLLAGRIRGLAVTATARIEELPNLPTVADTLPGFEVVSWTGLMAPARTPAAVMARLGESSAKALAMTEVKTTLSAAGMTPAYLPAEPFGAFVEADMAKWTRVARTANIKAD
jgi:tripartite-type tricarboxylate transporter receptor subunit TctC